MKKVIIFLIFNIISTLVINAQELIIPKHGNPINAYNLEISETFYFYTLEDNPESGILRIAKDSVLLVRRADGSTLSNTSDDSKTFPKKETSTNYPIIKDEDIHGSLIAEGNKVFIPTNSDFQYERAGQETLKEIISKWGYWTVVDDLEQAHFVLQFITKSVKFDNSFLFIRPRKYYREEPVLVWDEKWQSFTNAKRGIMVLYDIKTGDQPDENREAASTMAQKLKEIIIDRDSKLSKQFFKNCASQLDADAENNNGGSGIWYR